MVAGPSTYRDQGPGMAAPWTAPGDSPHNQDFLNSCPQKAGEPPPPRPARSSPTRADRCPGRGTRWCCWSLARTDTGAHAVRGTPPRACGVLLLWIHMAEGGKHSAPGGWRHSASLQSEEVKETTGRCCFQKPWKAEGACLPSGTTLRPFGNSLASAGMLKSTHTGILCTTPPTAQTPGKHVCTWPGSVALAAVGMVPQTPNLNRHLVSIPWTVPPNTQPG